MPELPEVERAKNDIKNAVQNQTITRVEAQPDTIVFDGCTSEEFSSTLTGGKLLDVKRYGKVFYFELEGGGKLPVFHFGMTGAIHIRGRESFKYKEGPKPDPAQWPPKFVKCIMHCEDEHGTITEIAFTDARRLGRIRLCEDPTQEHPISALGFDPILSMLPLEEYIPKVQRKGCPIKSLLLDQSFNAGVGNWVADEILYHSRVHPESKCNALTIDQITALHLNTEYVCTTAVSVNAESSLFPDNWLFCHRWGKGKREAHTLKLPNGDPATIKWITVGGRTSAFVAELQRKSAGTTSATQGKRARQSFDAEDQNEQSVTEQEEPVGLDPKMSSPQKRSKRRKTG
ncbi:AtMMH-1 [Flagelloscypha sp. PMI_526]|nr:AtMMH-1 [Flagelloscypha sp. PMI_526]